jgi:hypothetical protein
MRQITQAEWDAAVAEGRGLRGKAADAPGADEIVRRHGGESVYGWGQGGYLFPDANAAAAARGELSAAAEQGRVEQAVRRSPVGQATCDHRWQFWSHEEERCSRCHAFRPVYSDRDDV